VQPTVTTIVSGVWHEEVCVCIHLLVCSFLMRCYG
jgi:hypothetical protein